MHAQTKRQREVLDFIIRHIDSHGYRPSYAVIARHLGLNSRAGISRIVHDLESQGLLKRRRENGHFYIDMGASGGQSATGSVLIEWLDLPQDGDFREPWQDRAFVLPEFMLGYQTVERIRAYRVTDDGMAAEDIREDDVALIEVRQFVAVLNQNRSVLRKYYRAGAEIELRTADESDKDEIIRLAADRVEIKGVYRGLLRPVA
jgi:SOS-response transcriptional repressor LexA